MSKSTKFLLTLEELKEEVTYLQDRVYLETQTFRKIAEEYKNAAAALDKAVAKHRKASIALFEREGKVKKLTTRGKVRELPTSQSTKGCTAGINFLKEVLKGKSSTERIHYLSEVLGIQFTPQVQSMMAQEEEAVIE